MSSRRKQPPRSASETSSSTARIKQTNKPSTTTSPFLPLPNEALLLAAYPSILLLGSLYSTFTTSDTTATYSPAHQSYQPANLAPSYFARKSNIFNVYFVKIGWLWTTAALTLFLTTHPRHTPLSRLKAALRFLLATLVWFLTTQWFFGAPLIDRSFTLSGGACAISERERLGEVKLSEFARIASNAECKMMGGTWSGGIDISGHVFLLVLASGVLTLEVLPFLPLSTSTSITDGNEEAKGRASESMWLEAPLGVKVVGGVVLLMWWMLLMTAAFFHTWTEKLAGLLVALVGIWVVYYLPRGVAIFETVLGIPGKLL
jgi:alpha-galactosidase